MCNLQFNVRIQIFSKSIIYKFILNSSPIMYTFTCFLLKIANPFQENKNLSLLFNKILMVVKRNFTTHDVTFKNGPHN